MNSTPKAFRVLLERPDFVLPHTVMELAWLDCPELAKNKEKE